MCNNYRLFALAEDILARCERTLLIARETAIIWNDVDTNLQQEVIQVTNQDPNQMNFGYGLSYDCLNHRMYWRDHGGLSSVFISIHGASLPTK